MQKTSYYEYYEAKLKKSEADKKNQGNSTFNIESVMIEIIIKPLVERLIEIQTEITSQENLVSTLFSF